MICRKASHHIMYTKELHIQQPIKTHVCQVLFWRIGVCPSVASQVIAVCIGTSWLYLRLDKIELGLHRVNLYIPYDND